MKPLIIATIALTTILIGVYTGNSMDKKADKAMMDTSQPQAKAVFAGGCFWCTESDFEKVAGVLGAVSGYTGGKEKNPAYKEVSSGQTGHLEAIEVTYNPEQVSYIDLLEIFWRHVDPTDGGGQFGDRGAQYRSAIFFADEDERQMAEASKAALEASGKFDKPIATQILPLGPFYPAEDYHQDYYKKNPLRYRFYRSGSGRDQFLKKTWADHEKGMAKDMKMKASEKTEMKTMENDKKMMESGTDHGMKTKAMDNSQAKTTYQIPEDEKLAQMLSPMQFKVTRKNGTEPPFNNEYWNNHDKGIYVDIISGEPLFSSKDKFESGTGWPSFTQPLEKDNIVEKSDTSFFMVRTEVRSKNADSHLGHLFPDGPPPTGQRYCINSAALRFIPISDLEKEGYAEYRKLFE